MREALGQLLEGDPHPVSPHLLHLQGDDVDPYVEFPLLRLSGEQHLQRLTQLPLPVLPGEQHLQHLVQLLLPVLPGE